MRKVKKWISDWLQTPLILGIYFFSAMLMYEALYGLRWPSDSHPSSNVGDLKMLAMAGGIIGLWTASSLKSSESRISKLESELADLKSKLEAQVPPK